MHRIITLIAKELRALWRDKHGRILLIAPVLLQLVIFSFAATLEVKNNTLALWIEDAGAESVELVQRLVRAQAFTRFLRRNRRWAASDNSGNFRWSEVE
jgi:ABC-2 type transport system permease protein